MGWVRSAWERLVAGVFECGCGSDSSLASLGVRSICRQMGRVHGDSHCTSLCVCMAARVGCRQDGRLLHMICTPKKQVMVCGAVLMELASSVCCAADDGCGIDVLYHNQLWLRGPGVVTPSGPSHPMWHHPAATVPSRFIHSARPQARTSAQVQLGSSPIVKPIPDALRRSAGFADTHHYVLGPPQFLDVCPCVFGLLLNTAPILSRPAPVVHCTVSGPTPICMPFLRLSLPCLTFALEALCRGSRSTGWVAGEGSAVALELTRTPVHTCIQTCSRRPCTGGTFVCPLPNRDTQTDAWTDGRVDGGADGHAPPERPQGRGRAETGTHPTPASISNALDH